MALGSLPIALRSSNYSEASRFHLVIRLPTVDRFLCHRLYGLPTLSLRPAFLKGAESRKTQGPVSNKNMPCCLVQRWKVPSSRRPRTNSHSILLYFSLNLFFSMKTQPPGHWTSPTILALQTSTTNAVFHIMSRPETWLLISS